MFDVLFFIQQARAILKLLHNNKQAMAKKLFLFTIFWIAINFIHFPLKIKRNLAQFSM